MRLLFDGGQLKLLALSPSSFLYLFSSKKLFLFEVSTLVNGWAYWHEFIGGKEMLDTTDVDKRSDGKTLKREQFRFRRRLFAMVLILNTIVFVLAAFFLYQSRQNYHKEWKGEAANFAHVLELSLSNSIKKMELFLGAAAHELAFHNGASNTAVLDHFFQDHRFSLPELNSLVFFDMTGKARYRSDARKPEHQAYGKNTYADFLKSSPSNGRYFVKSFAEYPGGEWLVGIARRIKKSEGGVEGILLGSIKLNHFASALSDIKMGNNAVLALVAEGDAIVIRKQKIFRIEQKTATAQRYANPALEEFVKARHQEGIFRIKGATDGLNRMTAVRRIGDYPFYVFVGLAEKDYLSEWRHNAMIVIFVLLAFLVSTVLMMVAINIGWFRRMKLLEELEQKQKKFYELANMSSDWFWEFDENYRFVDVNGDLNKSGFSPDVIGLSPWDIAENVSEGELNAYRHLLETQQSFQDFQFGARDQEGEMRYISINGKPIFDEAGHFKGYHGTGRDITEKRRYEEYVRQMAQYDGLTGLSNRSLFYDRLEHAIRLAKREQRSFALLYLDLDKFKPINDQHGHSAGDQILQMVARRMRTVLRESDTVARLGGDEFAILLPNVTSLPDTENVAEKLIVVLSTPYDLENADEKVSVGVSVGIAFYPEDGLDGDSLMKSADASMYKSKRIGNCYYYCERFVEFR